MSRKVRFTLEKTPVGLQYVLPGAEQIKREASKGTCYAVDGAQLVIPGAESISTRELLARKMAAPIRPRSRQLGMTGTALFSRKR